MQLTRFFGRVSLIGCEFDGVEKPSVVEHVEAVEVRDVKINGKAVERID